MKRHGQDPGEPSTRRLRVGELIRHALVETLARDEVRDPDVAGRSITITEVTVSPDLRNATVFVEPLGGREVDKVLAGLNRSAAFLSGRVARTVRLKFAPRLVFRHDPSFDNADHIDRLLREAKARGPESDGA